MSETKNKTNNDNSINNDDELKQLKKKCDEYLSGWQRAKADYLNLKKEHENKTKEMIEYANAALLSNLISVFDNFKAAYAHYPESEDKEWKNWEQGIGHIKNQFSDFLNKFGIKEIKTIGEKFDPVYHESVGTEDSEEKEEGIILKEVKPGYMLHDKILVPARVIISK